MAQAAAEDLTADDDAADGEAELDPLDRQAQALAEKALEKLPVAVRALKLPKVKEGILKRLREQGQAQGRPAAGGQAQAAAPAAAPAESQPAPPVPEEPAAPQPPPPPPPAEQIMFEEIPGVEACGDERWFADIYTRRALRDSVAAGHAEQKILVGPAAEEIRRICPSDGRTLGAGGVLRLGGALLGGYSEADIAYAYRQLSRALHPDKNQDIPEAHLAFKRLSEAVEELRQSLLEARANLELLCATMGRAAVPELLERPQEGLFAEATRLLSAILSFSGEGEASSEPAARTLTAFAASEAFAKCHPQALLSEWFNGRRLIELFTVPTVRTAYDCSPKRFRAQFLCLLNRAALAEAKRQNECVRGNWTQIMQTYPELGLWRQFLDKVKERVWTLDEEEDKEKEGEDLPPWPDRPKPELVMVKPAWAPSKKSGEGKAGEGSKADGNDGSKKDPICWNFVTSGGRCQKGNLCKYMHTFPPGYRLEKAAEALSSRPLGPATPGRIPKDGEPPRKVIPRGSLIAATGKKKADKDKEDEDDREREKEEKEKEKADEKANAKTSLWARRWREAMRSVFPLSFQNPMPLTSPEVRKLSAALWKDIVEWAREQELERSLRLFGAEPSGRMDPGGAIHPQGEGADWAFLPATDLFLVLGEGIVAVTVEGITAKGPLGFKQETWEEASLRLNSERPTQEEIDKERDEKEKEEKEKDDKERDEKERDVKKEKKLLVPKKRDRGGGSKSHQSDDWYKDDDGDWSQAAARYKDDDGRQAESQRETYGRPQGDDAGWEAPRRDRSRSRGGGRWTERWEDERWEDPDEQRYSRRWSSRSPRRSSW